MYQYSQEWIVDVADGLDSRGSRISCGGRQQGHFTVPPGGKVGQQTNQCSQPSINVIHDSGSQKCKI